MEPSLGAHEARVSEKSHMLHADQESVWCGVRTSRSGRSRLLCVGSQRGTQLSSSCISRETRAIQDTGVDKLGLLPSVCLGKARTVWIRISLGSWRKSLTTGLARLSLRCRGSTKIPLPVRWWTEYSVTARKFHGHSHGRRDKMRNPKPYLAA